MSAEITDFYFDDHSESAPIITTQATVDGLQYELEWRINTNEKLGALTLLDDKSGDKLAFYSAMQPTVRPVFARVIVAIWEKVEQRSRAATALSDPYLAAAPYFEVMGSDLEAIRLCRG